MGGEFKVSSSGATGYIPVAQDGPTPGSGAPKPPESSELDKLLAWVTAASGDENAPLLAPDEREVRVPEVLVPQLRPSSFMPFCVKKFTGAIVNLPVKLPWGNRSAPPAVPAVSAASSQHPPGASLRNGILKAIREVRGGDELSETAKKSMDGNTPLTKRAVLQILQPAVDARAKESLERTSAVDGKRDLPAPRRGQARRNAPEKSFDELMKPEFVGRDAALLKDCLEIAKKRLAGKIPSVICPAAVRLYQRVHAAFQANSPTPTRNAAGLAGDNDPGPRWDILKRAGFPLLDKLADAFAVGGNEDAALLLTDQAQILLPQSPPSRWMRFKAALSGLPLLNRSASLRAARTRVTAVAIDASPFSSHLRTGVIEAIRLATDDDFADIAERLMQNKPLTKRTVVEILQPATNVVEQFEQVEVPRATRDNKSWVRRTAAKASSGRPVAPNEELMKKCTALVSSRLRKPEEIRQSAKRLYAQVHHFVSQRGYSLADEEGLEQAMGLAEVIDDSNGR
jgi:hypothetical protein